jgi:hypothetical protein
MSFLRLLGMYGAAAALKAMKSTPTMTWDELQTWISDVSNPDNYGRRYAQQRLPARRPDGHIEVRKEPLRGGKIRISAALFLAPVNQLVTSKDWEVEKIDAKLEKKFGDNLRFTIKV